MKQRVKRIIGVAFVFSLAVFQPAFAASDRLVATQEDIRQLEDDMNGKYYYLFSWGFDGIDANEVIAPLVIGSSADTGGIERVSGKDPLGLFSGDWGYKKISGSYLDAILSEIFHITPNHNYVDKNGGRCYGYYFEGYYYYQQEGLGGPQWVFDCEEYKQLTDGSYYITVNGGLSVENMEENMYVLADLERIQGERTWTFYRISDSPFSVDNIVNDVRVFIDGSEVAFRESPYVQQGNTMVPMRAIFEALGADVSYDAQSKKITAQKDGTQVILWIGQTAASVDGVLKQLPTAVINKNGSAMVPLRFVSEAFDADVAWDAESKTVTIRT